ncbi:hypothetical protein B0T25DRAFT_545859 [Lasiosphaeria hispida]|uniref:Uncharacterized protein n=1 Tax=Lasiosphaeria hispida TaxID=260671 RepID=A0AAJ0MF08_9PEZI|nr:hypothetical protein B0T25DRAFT_545859 [Lasiosphaeria hispida]
MKPFTMVASIAAFAGALTLGSPIQAADVSVAQDGLAKRQHDVTSVAITGFTAFCSPAPQFCHYSATITFLPENKVSNATLTLGGQQTFPANSGFWDTTDFDIFIRVNKVNQRYRIIVNDVHEPGSSITFGYMSPAADWPLKDRVQSYVGPSDFVIPALP